MALTVGELLATISVDDSEARAGMQRTEAAMARTGDSIVAEAEQAGAEAGDALAEGIQDGTEQGAEQGSGALAAFGWAAVGATVGAALMVGISEAMQQGQIEANLGAQLGSTPAEAAKYGNIAGSLYAGAIVESVEQGADIIKGIARNGLLPPEATEEQMSTLGRRVADTASVMGEDVSKVTRAVGTMMKNGLADSAEEALDVLTRGSQTGVDAAEDLLDTFSEYPTEFRQLGLNAETAMGLLSQGLQGGARDADTVADSLKEFTLMAQGMGESTAESFKALGLNAEQMQKVFQEGGPKAGAALDQVMDRLRAIKDPAKQSEIALGLFGTKSEDMQKAILGLDPSNAVDALGKIEGATDSAGTMMRDTAAHRFEAFKRGLMQGVVDVIGAYVVPALMTGADAAVAVGDGFAAAGQYVADNQGVFLGIATAITVVILPALVQWAIQQGITATAVVTGWVTTATASVTSAATQVASSWATIGGWVAMAGRAVWAGAVVVGQWVLMATQSLIQAARMAGAWLIAMGPIGLVIAAVVGLVVLIVTYWDQITAATTAAWDWIVETVTGAGTAAVQWFTSWKIWTAIAQKWQATKDGTKRLWNDITEWVRGIPGRIVGYFSSWNIASTISGHWDRAKEGAKAKGRELVDYARGLPASIASGIGNLGNLLVEKGRNVVQGLWNGIKSMGSWLKGQLISFAKTIIPGPIAKALGIASPSKVMARLGRWIPPGLVRGIDSTKGMVARAMETLVPAPSLPQFGGMGAPALAGASPYGTVGGTAPGAGVHIEHWHAAENGSPDDNARALAWAAKGRG
ncbi:phage tail tape measure protein [Streptomyces sp. NPDC058527]|uniref:phage tail tape measure protein n=1 Tax=unclassified Streptomyces TaxID=2593676 RepID=UPI00366186DE